MKERTGGNKLDLADRKMNFFGYIIKVGLSDYLSDY
jgi:hypothetical protein